MRSWGVSEASRKIIIKLQTNLFYRDSDPNSRKNKHPNHAAIASSIQDRQEAISYKMRRLKARLVSNQWGSLWKSTTKVPSKHGNSEAFLGDARDALYSIENNEEATCSPYWATVIVALFEVTPPDVAVTVEVPTVAAVASPVDEMLATELGTDVHVEMVVTSAVEPSL